MINITRGCGLVILIIYEELIYNTTDSGPEKMKMSVFLRSPESDVSNKYPETVCFQ